MDKIRAEFEKRTNLIELVQWSDYFGSFVPKKACDGHIATAINEQYDAFYDGYEAAKASQWISVEDATLNEESTYWVCDWSGDVFTAKYWDGDHPFFGGTDGEFYARLENVALVIPLDVPEAPE